jgi:hypothetical protein
MTLKVRVPGRQERVFHREVVSDTVAHRYGDTLRCLIGPRISPLLRQSERHRGPAGGAAPGSI